MELLEPEENVRWKPEANICWPYIALFKFCVLLFFLSLNPQYLVFEPAYCGFKDMKGPHCIAEVGGRQKPRRQMNVAVVHLLARDISPSHRGPILTRQGLVSAYIGLRFQPPGLYVPISGRPLTAGWPRALGRCPSPMSHANEETRAGVYLGPLIFAARSPHLDPLITTSSSIDG